MQEHIRRAHPEKYISKLPATEESFQLMISTPASAPSQPPSNSAQPLGNSGTSVGPHRRWRHWSHAVHGTERETYSTKQSSPAPSKQHEEIYPAAATAAVALAQLHSQRPDSDWGSEAVRRTPSKKNTESRSSQWHDSMTQGLTG